MRRVSFCLANIRNTYLVSDFKIKLIKLSTNTKLEAHICTFQTTGNCFLFIKRSYGYYIA